MQAARQDRGKAATATSACGGPSLGPPPAPGEAWDVRARMKFLTDTHNNRRNSFLAET